MIVLNPLLVDPTGVCWRMTETINLDAHLLHIFGFEKQQQQKAITLLIKLMTI